MGWGGRRRLPGGDGGEMFHGSPCCFRAFRHSSFSAGKEVGGQKQCALHPYTPRPKKTNKHAKIVEEPLGLRVNLCMLHGSGHLQFGFGFEG